MLKPDPLVPRIGPCQHGFLKMLSILKRSHVDFVLGFRVDVR